MIIRILQISVILIAIIAINSVSALIKADIHKKRGKEFLNKGYSYAAADEFGKSLKSDRTDGEARGYLGIAYTNLAEKTNDIEKKKVFLNNTLYEIGNSRKTYQDPFITYNLAIAHEISGDIDNAIQEAIKSYNQIPSGEAKEKLIALYKIKGDTLLSQNKKDEAIEFYKKIVELKGIDVKKEDTARYEFLRNLMPDNFMVRYCLAKLYMEQTLWDKAVIELEYIKKTGIFNDDIMRKLALTYYMLGRKYYNETKFKEAEVYLSDLINLRHLGNFDYLAESIDILARVYGQIENIDKAVETFMKLEDIDTYKGQGYYQIGRLFSKISDTKKAIEYYEKYLPFRPISDIEIFITLGNLYGQIGNTDKAVETFMKLEDIDTYKGQGYYQIGRLFSKRSDTKKAIEYFEKYLPFRPIPDTDIFITLGNLYGQVGDIDKAVKSYSKLEDINSTKGQGHYYSGLLYEKKERWVDALNKFELASKINTKNSDILLKIGQLYEKLGNNKKALEICKKAIIIDPLKEAELNPLMIKLYEKIGEKEKVITSIKMLKREPGIR